ncbi:MAG TPA: acylneuraminate cytidylyltransferase family protein, partial [Candidatus Bathyarchaeia archaeon]|nr:acylneuraminate cytidylyltransferase family protein [Candidatus Bathyarchaeia archaeon]
LSQRIDGVFISTDSKEYADIAQTFGASAPFLRPVDISQDDSTDKELFGHFFDYFRKANIAVPQLVVHLRPTTPLRDIVIIDQAIAYMLQHPEATALRSMYKTHLTPYKMFRREGEFAKPFLSYPEKEFYNLPRQTFEDSYQPNGYVDIIRPEVLLETGLLHGDRIKLWETPKVADIDVLEDVAWAETLLKQKEFAALKKYLEERHG